MAVIAHAGYHEYQGIATDLAERESIVRDLGDNKVPIMRNHDLLTVGRTAGEAFMSMYRAERACYMQLSFHQAGAELNPIPEDVQRTTVDRNRFNNSELGLRPIGKVDWPALRRKLAHLDPP